MATAGSRMPLQQLISHRQQGHRTPPSTASIQAPALGGSLPADVPMTISRRPCQTEGGRNTARQPVAGRPVKKIRAPARGRRETDDQGREQGHDGYPGRGPPCWRLLTVASLDCSRKAIAAHKETGYGQGQGHETRAKGRGSGVLESGAWVAPNSPASTPATV